MKAPDTLLPDLVERNPQILWRAGAQGGFEYVSPRWRELTGGDPAQALGDAWIDVVHPEDRNAVTGIWRERRRARRPLELECRIRGRDGGYRWVLLSAIPVPGEAGAAAGWSGSFTDIDALARSRESLRELNRRKDEFIATLAHELRNPLAPIRSSLDILRITSGSGPAAERAHAILERQVTQLVRLVDDLLEVSRAAGGRIELRRERVDLNAVLHVAVENSRPLLEAAKHRLSIEVPPRPVTMSIDPVRITQAITNLLQNAALYTPDGGQIRLQAAEEADELVIRVQDTGTGIREEDLPRIFDLFTPVERAGRGTPGSLGLGLPLARAMIEKHGGRIEARSDGPGRGAEFIVRLPLRDASPLSRDLEPTAAWGTLCDRRVLVVDDSRDSADSLGILLRHLGADAHVCYDGASALERLRTFHAKVVFLDIAMPGMDGYETARRIRARPELQDVMLVALTGWGQEEDRRRTKSAGFARHLLKPVDADSLKSLLLSLEASGRPVTR